MKKIQTLTLTMMMGAAVLSSCGDKKNAENAEGQGGAKTEAAAKPAMPADTKVYKSSDLTEKMPNEAANVAFDASVISTLDNLMEGNEKVEALYFDHEYNMLGNASFKDCKNLKKVQFDALVQVCGDYCFQGCTSLTEAKLKTCTIGESCFDGCTSLEKVILDDNGWNVRVSSLANCPNLKTVIVPQTLEILEEGAFTGSKNIEELAVPYNFKDHIYTFVAEAKNIKKLYILTPAYYSFPTKAAAKAFNKAQCEVYVPDAAIEDFKKDPNWAAFAAVKPLSESGYFTADCHVK